jgi:hypothetical protein
VFGGRNLPAFARDGLTGRAAGRHLPDRPDEALSVAQRDPKLFEVVFAQLRQNIDVDSVLGEC